MRKCCFINFLYTESNGVFRYVLSAKIHIEFSSSKYVLSFGHFLENSHHGHHMTSIQTSIREKERITKVAVV